MTNQPPLNLDALDHLAVVIFGCSLEEWNEHIEYEKRQLLAPYVRIIETYLAVAQPVVTGEQVNLAGWTCNGIHEPGDYSTCEECRDACDDLARFYNHMMRNPRPFKHWTGSPEVKP